MITNELWKGGVVRIGFFEVANACIVKLFVHYIPRGDTERMFYIPLPDKYTAAKVMEQMIIGYKKDGAKVLSMDGDIEL